MNALDRDLLEALQYEFPLVPRPFAALGAKVGQSEQAVIARVKQLKKAGIVRQISAIFDSAKIGYTSTLAAFKVEPSRLDNVAEKLSLLPGVSHNYERAGDFNLWFTLTLPSKKDIENEVAALASANRVSRWLYLPSLRQFKVSFRLPMGSKRTISAANAAAPDASATTLARPAVRMPRINRRLVQELQKDIPVAPRPFRGAARKMGMTETELLDTMKSYVACHAARRFAAVLRQTKAGFTANVMVAWAPKESQKERLGIRAAELPMVSHCYERPTSVLWPYSVYTMIHGKSMKDCNRTIKQITKLSGVSRYTALKTIREFKKERVQYFSGKS